MKETKTIRLSLLSVALCFGVSISLWGQTPQDSLAIANAAWSQKKIEKGMVLKSASLTIFDSKQQVTFVEINPSKHPILFLQPQEGRVKTSEQALRAGAKAAINAGFFNMQLGGPVDFVKVDNKVIARTQDTSFVPNGAVVVDGKRVDVIPWSAEIEQAEVAAPKYKNVLVSKVILMDQGQIVPIKKSSFATTRHPRSVIGVNKRGEVFLLVVDGRNAEHAVGMSLYELAYLTKQLGMTDALNLDGGGSSTLWLLDEGVVNYPSDNKLFDHEGERKVNNIIIAK